MAQFRSIDPSTLPQHFDAPTSEKRCIEEWEQSKFYHWDPNQPRDNTFVVDTPPPTASGSLHLGHIFSYTQTDVVVRFQRMMGKSIYYPMGWDDNGLPTERRVQNVYHVRVDVKVPYEPGLKMEHATPERMKKEPPKTVSRPNFIELCHIVTGEDEKTFKALFQRLGLSVDWREEYATINDRCRKLAQMSFRDLYEKNEVYSVVAPTMWDVDFQTAVAQAEVEDRPQAGALHNITFGVQGSERDFVIATTRPELLPACVGVTAHPEDPRFKDLFGKFAITPIFHMPVPIFPSTLADPEKGTGILMVCTFGDATDVTWWTEQKLALRQVIGRNGRLMPVNFGDDGWESVKPAAANEAYAPLVGKTVHSARTAVVELLRNPAHSATVHAKGPLVAEPATFERPVKFFEKGDRPLEFIPTRQWFVKLMQRKAEMVERGQAIKWYPGFMETRYRTWTEGLQSDWCISRQRYFGVQIPVWYPLDSNGNPDHDHPIVAAYDTLPVDPTTDVPPGYTAQQRGQPGGFAGETDVFDTWFTSSLTPQIGSHWALDPSRHKMLFPADVRPQAHEIIRTWAFYTIAKALLHEKSVPWHNILISGWILDPDRKKMSKSKGNAVTPMHLLDSYTSDGVRYWAAGARLGTDTTFDEKVLKVGKRLVTKIFNAGKYVLGQTGTVHPISHELDRAFVSALTKLVEDTTAAHSRFEYAAALEQTEAFFWSNFTDTYLELVKFRSRDERPEGEKDRGSAISALRLGLNVLLRLFAPVLPFITEEVWTWSYAAETGHKSVHIAPWPTAAELSVVAAPTNPRSLAIAGIALSAINKRKTELGASVGRGVKSLTLAAGPATYSALKAVLEDVASATRSKTYNVVEKAEITDDTIAVESLDLEPPAEKTES